MSRKTPQTAIATGRPTIEKAAVVDEQDIFFQSATYAQGGPVWREGQVVTYELVRGPGGEWHAINIEIVEDAQLN